MPLGYLYEAVDSQVSVLFLRASKILLHRETQKESYNPTILYFLNYHLSDGF